MNINGGFPPIEYIKIKTDENKNNKNEVKKERFYAMIPKKNLNIRQILNNNIKKNMINNPKQEIEIIKSF
jgi:hypothetical protein